MTLDGVLGALPWRTFVSLLLALVLVAPAAANVGTRAHPYKHGAIVRVDGGFALRVLATDTNAWRSLKLKGSGGRAPMPGRSDVLVTMQATNRAKIEGIPFVDGSLGAIGAFGNAYSSIAQSCGTVSGDVSTIDPVPPGETVIVHTCWQVPNRDAKSLVMYYAPYDGSRKTYFALR